MSKFRFGSMVKLFVLIILGISVWIFTQHIDNADQHIPPLHMPSLMKKTSEKNHFIKFTGKTWKTFTDIDSPGVYRACVPRPSDYNLKSTVTGGIVAEDERDMTVDNCLKACIDLKFTYAALGRGTQCLCGDIKDKKSEQIVQNYQDSKLCDVACSGETQYNCGGQQFLSLYRTNIPDQRCSKIELKPKGSLHLVALASYPRSGNTWTRQLIEKASGIYTGSTLWRHEKTMTISQKVFLGGNIDYKLQRTVCVKAHSHALTDIKQFTGAIVLIRNPYRTLVAEVFRRMMIEKNKSPETILKYFQSKNWNEFVENQIGVWKSTALNWINKSPKVLVVNYEDLEENTFRQIQKMMNFLHVDTTDERINCAIHEHPSSKSTGLSLGNHFRKTRVYLTENPFTDTQKILIDRNVKVVNSTLIAKGLTPLPSDYSVTVF